MPQIYDVRDCGRRVVIGRWWLQLVTGCHICAEYNHSRHDGIAHPPCLVSVTHPVPWALHAMAKLNPIFRYLSSLDVVLATVFLLLVIALIRARRRLSIPGPVGLPFLGVALQIPSDKQWLKFHAWTARYGV